ncbi:hypothetical protein BJY00DRAFT_291015 [Aspergillus carlsbadensis]|nr:hypothetical protein BJY00DRAFT_291015 [Aspergillus carlsbadensis]
MTETLLDFLRGRNPTVIAPVLGSSKFTFSDDWETVEDMEVWTEFTYETLISRFGSELQREAPQFDATALSEEAGYNRFYDERGLSDLICMSIMGPVSSVLGPLFITSGGRVMEKLECAPDWGSGHRTSTNSIGRSKALILGDTKFKWSSQSGINTVRNKVDDSYEEGDRDDVRPIEQVIHYGSLYNCRYVFLITEKVLVVMQLHLAPDPVRTSPRPVRTRSTTSHERIVSSSTVSQQMSDMSLHESDLKRRIGLPKYKTIPWGATSGLTIKLALYCLIRLASEGGSDLKQDYSPLPSTRALVTNPKPSGISHNAQGASKRKSETSQPSRKKSRDHLGEPLPRTRYTHVGTVSDHGGTFYKFRIGNELQMKYKVQWVEVDGYLYHDGLKVKGRLLATVAATPSERAEYTYVGELEAFQGVFYSFTMDGEVQTKYQDQWTEEGGYLFHDDLKVRGRLKK